MGKPARIKTTGIPADSTVILTFDELLSGYASGRCLDNAGNDVPCSGCLRDMIQSQACRLTAARKTAEALGLKLQLMAL